LTVSKPNCRWPSTACTRATLLVSALADFHAMFPTVPFRLLVQPRSGVERVVRNGHASVGLGSPVHMKSSGLRLFHMEAVWLVPVAAPGRPLAPTDDASPPRALQHALPSDQRGVEGRDFSVVSQATWRVGEFEHEAQAASPRTWVGRNAGADGPRRYRGRKARAIGPR
jgi:hypothetical protein